jgi:hypothetical protein
MALENLFSLAGLVVVPGWLMLLLAPAGWRVRAFVVLSALLLSLLYAGLIGTFWMQGQGGFGSLADVAALFAHPGLLLAGWVHYLAFDLLVGLWEREEATRIGLSRWLLAPCLALTFMFGPIGWLLFMTLRVAYLRRSRAPAAPDLTRAQEAQ